jgi:hypothetical protein
MGEVRFIWPDLISPKAQIKFSSLVEGMYLRGMVAVVRWVLKDQAEPTIGLCVPEFNYPGDEKRLDYMFWVKVGRPNSDWEQELIAIVVAAIRRGRTSLLVSFLDDV